MQLNPGVTSALVPCRRVSLGIRFKDRPGVGKPGLLPVRGTKCRVMPLGPNHEVNSKALGYSITDAWD